MNIKINFQFESIEEFTRLIQSISNMVRQEKDIASKNMFAPTPPLGWESNVKNWLDSQADAFKNIEIALTESMEKRKADELANIGTTEKKPYVFHDSVSETDQKNAPLDDRPTCPVCKKKFIQTRKSRFCSRQCCKKNSNINYKLKMQGKSVPAVAPVEKTPVPEPLVKMQETPPVHQVEHVEGIVRRKYNLQDQSEKLKKIRKEIPISEKRPEYVRELT